MSDVVLYCASQVRTVAKQLSPTLVSLATERTASDWLWMILLMPMTFLVNTTCKQLAYNVRQSESDPYQLAA